MNIEKNVKYGFDCWEDHDDFLRKCEDLGYTWLDGEPATYNTFWNENKVLYEIDYDGCLGFYDTNYRSDFVTYRRDCEKPDTLDAMRYCIGVDANSLEEALEHLKNKTNCYFISRDGNKTIVKTPDGKTGVSRCHPDDKYNFIEGVKVAINNIKKYEFNEKEIHILKKLQETGFDIIINHGSYFQADCKTLNGNSRWLGSYIPKVFQQLKEGKEYKISELLD